MYVARERALPAIAGPPPENATLKPVGDEPPDMKYLVAVDGSEESDAALAHALDVADAMDATVTVAHAVDPAVSDEGGGDPIASLADADRQLIVESVEDAERRGRDLLDDAVEFAERRGHEVEAQLLYGDPVESVPDYADEEGFDAIFVGHRGRSERAARLVGSVAKGLVERAAVPVTVVR